ncbi:hypothetical protein [Leptospira mayottensis]|uniref:hypothetical protein n=1 Tax=Leptospira mayottensis TaxID=1137606 RepID=UPI000E35DC7E|nr:hypothetical protein [Leptospira mayottensis]AXR66832.1 hypothetical protein DPV73_01090 [Leptospira mayottensis]AXR66845.1 hypothetical protein DPV73_01170 [Leptospira mayottensis]
MNEYIESYSVVNFAERLDWIFKKNAELKGKSALFRAGLFFELIPISGLSNRSNPEEFSELTKSIFSFWTSENIFCGGLQFY